MTRTSFPQFVIFVEYMEKYGDLSKPSDRTQGRLYAAEHWKKLSEALNVDLSGDPRTIEKWKRVDTGKRPAKKRWLKFVRDNMRAIGLSNKDVRMWKNARSGLDIVVAADPGPLKWHNWDKRRDDDDDD
ncbi:unnamed protein product [Euphydryas editha]|uniref:Regulatory protein zeste n=1 Tax=Euphydryas editha TaxID=104508 RepID=A0AAU9VCN8_EUPED|nr:unnamed protein product [Euphydryas editha]